MKSTLVALMAGALLLGACGETDQVPGDNAPSMDTRGTGTDQPVQHMAAESMRREITDIFDRYLDIKDALVRSDAEDARENARALVSELTFDTAPLTVDEGKTWNERMQSLKTSAGEIASATDLAQQRESFAMLSSAMESTVRDFGMMDKTAYRQYCPMAFDNKGGYWLAADAEVNNPYFGDEMLHCGAVEDTLAF